MSRTFSFDPDDFADGTHEIEVTVTDELGHESHETWNVTTSFSFPLVPPVDSTVAESFSDQIDFLYEGTDPLQIVSDPSVFEEAHQAVLTGSVIKRDSGSPAAGVRVDVIGHPEYGTTTTLPDGTYYLAVNGGGRLWVRFSKPGFFPAEREVETPWRDYVTVEDVALVRPDSRVTEIDLSQPLAPMQVATSSPSPDGARQATLLFPTGTNAWMEMADGSQQAFAGPLQVRATEYTVGSNGVEAMPAPLPATSAYTYAAEFSVDEALEAGAAHVRFNQPVLSYTENFIGFPVGTDVPNAYYDTAQGAWVPDTSGRVIKLTAETAQGGQQLAELDITGAGQATEAELTEFGITLAERAKLAELYEPGQSLWRVPLTQFSPHDYNWSWGPPLNALALMAGLTPLAGVSGDCEQPGSIVGCMNQTLGEELPVTGTDFSLRYQSERVPGRKAAYSLEIPLRGESVPPSLKRIELKVAVAGTEVRESFPASTERFRFTWDGKDAFGRQLQGVHRAQVAVGYVYDAVYTATRRFAAIGGPRFENLPTRQEAVLWRTYEEKIGTWDAAAQGLGGWTLDVHHAYDPEERVVHLGSGDRIESADELQEVGPTPLSVDSSRPWQRLDVTADGTIYGMQRNHLDRDRVYEINPDGSVRAVTNDTGAFGDFEVAADGTVYYTSSARIWKQPPTGPDGDGVDFPVAGTGVLRTGPPSAADEGKLASEVQLAGVSGLALAPDGTMYVSEPGDRTGNGYIRKIDPDGRIYTIAGNGDVGADGAIGDGGPARDASLLLPREVELGPDGSLYVNDSGHARIRRIAPNGTISTFAGIGIRESGQNTPLITGGYSGDGGPATEARIRANQIDFAPDGALVFSNTKSIGFVGANTVVNGEARIRAIGRDGIIRTLVGGGNQPLAEGVALTAAELAPEGAITASLGVAVRPGGELVFGNDRLWRAMESLPAHADGDVLVPSPDGSEVYRFSSDGRHLETRSALTNVRLYGFGYDDEGRLTSITDADGNVTAIERDAAGAPTAIVSPFGQRSPLTTNSAGYLESIANPAGETNEFGYGVGGLLTSLTTPRDKTYSFTYDELGRLTRDEDPAGGFQTLTRTETADGFAVTHTTAGGRETTYSPARVSTGNAKRSITEPNGLTATVTQSLGGLTTVDAADGTTRSTSSRAETATTGSGEEVRATRRFGMQAPVTASRTVTTPGGRSLQATGSRDVHLSDDGDLFSLTELTNSVTVNGRTGTSVFDRSAMRFTTTSPADRRATIELDELGRPVREEFGLRDATGSESCGSLCPSRLAPVTYTYDDHGRIESESQGARATTYSYDSDGNLATATDPLNRVTSFTYDDAGRIVTQTLPDMRVIAYAYDADGNLTSVMPPSRPAHTFAHNAVGLASTYTPPVVGAPGPTQYSYTPDKQFALVTRANGEEIDPAYDSAGRVDTITHPDGVVDYGYSSQTGNLSSVDVQDGQRLSLSYDGSLPTSETFTGATEGTVSRAYDDSFRITSTAVNGANSVSFSYDDDSLLTQAGALSIDRDARDGLLSGTQLGSISTGVAYNVFGEVETLSASDGATELFAETYDRDNGGRVTTRTDTLSGDVYSYTYEQAAGDQSRALTEVRKNGEVVGSYGYDANGNRTSHTALGGTAITASYDDQDRLVRYGSTEYAYNDPGDLVSKTDTAAGQTTAFDYDAFGSLLGVDLPNGTQIDYIVDGFGRRVAKKVDGEVAQRFLYAEPIGPIAELDTANQVVSRFVYGTRSNVPDYMVKGGTTYRIVSDHLGSPQLVVNAGTGEIVQELDYDEFGVITRDTNPGFQPFGFAGGFYDQDTKLTRFGARDYDAETGRWTTKDPIGFAGGDTNLYGYVLGDPINFVDPSGLILGIPTPSGSDLIHSVAGAYDGATFGLTNGIRERLGWNDGLDKCSSAYRQSNMGGKLTTSVALGMAGGAGGAMNIARLGGGAAAQAIGGGAVGGMVETSAFNDGTPSVGQLASSAATGAAGGFVGDVARGAESVDTAAREAMAGGVTSGALTLGTQGLPSVETCGC